MSLTLSELAAPQHDLPVAIIGAGPVGLAAAAHLIERGITPLVLEAGATVGANLLAYAHVRLFSPWQYNVDSAMASLLAASGSLGWHAPPAGELPCAGEVVERVLKPFAALPRVAAALRLNTEVLAISREGFDKVKTSGRDSSAFIIRAVQDGQPVELRARAVIDASGTWRTPNPLGANGLPAAGEREHADAIFYGIPDVLGAQRSRYAGKRTLVVGAGHSAANTLLALAELAQAEPNTQLAWAVRTPTLTRVFGGGDTDALPARGQLGAALKALRDSARLEFISGLRIQAVRRDGTTLTIIGSDADRQPMQISGIDQIICATGQRPDLSLTRELRLSLDPWLESSAALGPLIDPNLHSCGTVRAHGHRELAHAEIGFYTLGAKSYGRAPTFLMATGFEQARSVVAALAGDLPAADRVALDLPATGVCNVGATAAPNVGSACCGDSVDGAASTASVPTPMVVPVAVSAAVAAATPARCCG